MNWCKKFWFWNLLVQVIVLSQSLVTSSWTGEDINESGNHTKVCPQSEKDLQVTLPKCMNVIVSMPQLHNDSQGFLHINTPRRSESIEDYTRISESEVELCYPLSPQLRNCPLKRHRMQCYSVSNFTLTESETNLTAKLGDYYIDDQGEAYTCKVSLVKDSVPRCHYLQVSPGDYIVYDNGSFSATSTDILVRHPDFSLDDNRAANVCVPLTLCFFTTFHYFLEPPDYTILPNKQLYYKEAKETKLFDEYFPYGKDFAICGHDYPTPKVDVFLIYTGFHIASAICLVITVIYQLLVNNMIKCHQKCFLCHIVSMMILYLGWVVRKLMPVENITNELCYTLFITMYFTNMSAFTWLNVLSFDLCHGFSNMKMSPRHCRIPMFKTHRFTFYSIVAWGIPVVLLTVALVVDANKALQDQVGLHPRISYLCWFNESPSLFVFYYIPLMIVTILNIVFFLVSAYLLLRASKGTQIVNRKRNVNLLFVCIKLFVVMGLCWVCEIIVFFVDPHKWWTISDAVTSVQGIAVFIIYICKHETYLLIKRKVSNFCSKGTEIGTTAVNERKIHQTHSNETLVSVLSSPD